MLVKEYDAMMEAKGTPKVYVVESGSSTYGSGLLHSKLYLTEEEAKEAFDKIPDNYCKHMYRTWDIWNFTERHRWDGIEREAALAKLTPHERALLGLV